VVTIIPDAGERYIASFNPEWMSANGLTEAAAYMEAQKW
jgi:hypothetical protein